MAGPNASNQVDNVTPAETIKAGFDKYNAHWHEYEAATLTNSAAGSTAVGDVLAVSSQTAILGDTVSSLQTYVVAMAVIANAATGEFARSGVVSAKANGAIAAMQYVRKSATARCIEDAGTAVGATTTPPAGAVGIALAAASGGFCTILLFERTVTAALETGTWSDVTGSRVLGTVYQNTSGKKRRVSINATNAVTASRVYFEISASSPPGSSNRIASQDFPATGTHLNLYAEVPAGWYYRTASSDANYTLIGWWELDE